MILWELIRKKRKRERERNLVPCRRHMAAVRTQTKEPGQQRVKWRGESECRASPSQYFNLPGTRPNARCI